MSNTKQIDFRERHVEHCCICGKEMSEDEAILDEHDETWCPECLNEALARYESMIEQMKAEKRKSK